MPRRRCQGYGGLVFHVTNRAVRRAPLFFTPEDYLAFLAVLVEAAARFPAMRLLAWTMMKNHWHLVLWPREDGDLTAYVSWLTLTHACRWHRVHETRGTGHVYRGRFSAVPVETGWSLFKVCCYVERNAVRAHIVERAEDWPWSSASSESLPGKRPPLHDWPTPKPPQPEWSAALNEPNRNMRLRQLHQCLMRNAPYGSDAWRDEIARRLHWTRGIRPPGRPRKKPQEEPLPDEKPLPERKPLPE